MNIRKLLLGSIAVMVSAFALTSCDSDDTYYYYVPYQANAIVTVKTAENGDWYMQLDDSTTLYATNIHQAPYNKEVRALVSCYETGGDANGYSKAVFVNQIDSFLTKPAVTCPTGDIDKIYGNDPIEIVKSWMTVAEDGYLTLRVRTLWGANGKPHYINLLTGLNPDNPYEVELRQNAYGDTQGHWGDALVAFKLNNLPLSGKTTITVKYQSFSGEKKVDFTFNRGSIASESAATEPAPYSERLK